MKILGRKIRMLIAVVVCALALTAAASSAAAPFWSEFSGVQVGGNTQIEGLVSTGANDVWAFGWVYTGGPLNEFRAFGEHWNGVTWTRLNLLDNETAPARDLLHAAAASGPHDVWTVGQSAISAASGQNRDLIEHWNGTWWQIVDPGLNVGLSRGLLAVAAPDADHTWAVGEDVPGGGPDYVPLVFHRSGTTWANVRFTLKVPGCKSPARGELRSVAARSDSDVYVAGWCQSEGSTFGREHDFIAHWDGTGWSLAYEAPVGDEIKSITEGRDGEIWAGGDNYNANPTTVRGLLWHSSPAWAMVKLPANANLGGTINAVAAGKGPKGLVYAAGGYITKDLVANYVVAYNPVTGLSHYERILPLHSTTYIFVHALTIGRGGQQPWLGGLSDTATASPAFLAQRQTG